MRGPMNDFARIAPGARGVLTAGLVALAAVSGACGEEISTGGLGDPCRTSTDCRAELDLACIDDRCASDPATLNIAFEVEPPPGFLARAPLTREAFLPFERADRREWTLQMSRANDVRLAVDQQVDVDIFRLDDTLPGRSHVRSLRVFQTTAGRPELSTVRLLPGAYEFRVEPAAALPPTLVREAVGTNTATVSLPTAGFSRLRGRVVQSTQQDRPISDVLVYARGVTSGRTSSRALSDEDGAFSIQLFGPEFDDREIDIFAIPDPEAQPAWSYRERIPLPEAPIGDVVIPLELPVEEERRCIELAVFGGSQRVPRARVDLVAVDTRADTIAYELSGRGRSDGVVERLVGLGAETATRTTRLPIMAGTYEVRIRPPTARQPSDPVLDLSEFDYARLPSNTTLSGLPFGNTVTTVEIPRTDGPVTPGRDPCATDAVAQVQVSVDIRKMVIGRVTSESRPLSQPPFVVFEPAEAPLAETFSLRPSNTGDFAVFMEPGCFVWTVAPSGGDGRDLPLGFGVLEVSAVGSGGTGLTQRLPLPLSIPSGLTVGGRVLNPDALVPALGTGVPLARVRAYAAPPESNRTVLVGQAEADDQGGFRLRLPTRQSRPPTPCP